MDYSNEMKMLQSQIDSENARHTRQIEYFKTRKKAISYKRERQRKEEERKKALEKLKNEDYNKIKALNNAIDLLLQP